MKKLLLSFFMCMLAIIGVQAEESVTFDFTTPTSLTPSIDAPAQGNGTNIGTEPFVSGVVSISATDGGTASRIWNSSGEYDLRLYNGATLTIAVQDGYVLKTIVSTGTQLGITIQEPISSITKKITATTKIKTITVTYDVVSETPVVVVPKFAPVATDFVGHIDVELDAEDDIYYSFEEKGEYVLYEKAIPLTKTTTVYAYAQNAENKSDVVSATYTKVAPERPSATPTLSFASTAQRVSQTSEQQVWWNDGITFINNKASSTNNIIDSSDPVRLYKNSQIIVECEQPMTKIEFTCNTNDYATALKNSISESATLSKSVVTVTFAEPTKSYTIASLTSGQVRMNSLTVSCLPTENITYGMYYLSLGESDVEGATWYAAHFVNANNGNDTWVYGRRVEDSGRVGVHFGLKDQENTYTHIAFCAMMCDAPVFNEEKGELDDVGSAEKLMNWEFVYAHTDYVTYVPATTPGCVSVYNYNDKVWEEANPQIATSLDRVEVANGIGYAYGVVSAEGAIEVYNVNGAVVARGNNNVDLRGLGRGVYIIRTGNQVRKVVR